MSGVSGKAERKYLADHAEPEARLCEAFGEAAGRYAHVLVIPASGEGPELEQTLASIPAGPLGSVLTILVINATPDAPPAVHKANARALEGFARGSECLRPLAPNATLYAHTHGELLVLDRTTHPRLLPAGQGVGLARKIGTDLALALVVSDRVTSRWIHVSDADVVFPTDYFQQLVEADGGRIAARLYRFRHLSGSDPRAYQAALEYEVSLRYYVLGLRFARSPYAFHSIGSTLALYAGSYARVRGFPRRTAAEDFYLLDKLAKLGRIEKLSGAPLGLSSRVSSRVPFGTGAAIARVLEDGNQERATYDPRLFHYLRAWLEAVDAAILQRTSASDGLALLEELLRQSCGRDAVVDAGLLLSALKQTGALADAAAALVAPARVVRGRIHERFDGFRTLKLLHALRDSGLPNLRLREALGSAAFLSLPKQLDRVPLGELASRIEALDDAAAEASVSIASTQAPGP